jgi:hypothetical protein
MLAGAVDDTCPVEPGHHGEPPGDGSGLESANLLHPADVELQLRPLRDQRVHLAVGVPGQVAAQIGFGVLAGGAPKAGQVGSHCQRQPVGERLRRIGEREGQLGVGRHALTLQRPAATVKLTSTHLAADARIPATAAMYCATSLKIAGTLGRTMGSPTGPAR